ncbi:MAG: ribonuclease HIII [Bacteroidetes bacterium]|nr:ribonuclease HIII [Bacteroidota bacterium]MBU1115842.1 ribonuclease HIII [Bacteroidota bacterium]MBU1800553.1 ribonuclease HIII [Bacteroidota bacterium]
MNIKETAKEKTISTRNQLIEVGLTCSNLEEKQYNFEFVTQSDRDKIKVQVYFGKKGVKTILQGNNTSILYTEIYPIIFEQAALNLPTDLDEPKEYIGSDESGKGDVFGPLITTAFYVDEKAKLRLSQLGVCDSKQLNEAQITSIAKKIREEFSQNFETIPLFPEKYNELYGKFNNLNALLIWTHSKAISNLLEKYKCKNIIVDKFSNRALNITNNNSDNKLEILQLTNGERYIGVAAASIIARDTFNRWFIKMKKDVFDFPKGASKNVEETVKFFSKKHSFEELKAVSKIHFKTVQKFI